MEEEFLAENNACGQTLLHLVSRGNAIIAELLRLKDHIPPIFRLEKKQDQQKYGEIILDFGYFNSSDEFDKKIENNEQLRKLDEEIYEAHGEILARFYKAFESVHKYVTDLNTFIEELEEGVYIQQTLDTVFISQEGIQLMCESIYVYGVMLLILDLYHTGQVRERLVVAYSRHSTTAGTLDHVCQLVRSTGFVNSPSVKRPSSYPQDYFRRVPLNSKLVNAAVGKLRTEDIYHQQKALPLPQHSTAALSQQAAVLTVVLFFAPNILHGQAARMREIVDKFFPDSWVVNIYMGITMNLIDMWDPFKAAKTALGNTLEPSNIKDYAKTHAASLEKLLSETNEILKEGVLVKKNLLDNVSKVLSLARECNVTLRWLMLHTAPSYSVCETVKKCKQVRDQVLADTQHSPSKLLELLLNTAHFENNIRELFKSVFNEREEKWAEGKRECSLRVGELRDVFAGTKPLMRVDKNDNLQKWFSDIESHIESLNLEEPNISARKIVQLIQALDEVQGYPQMTSNLQVKQLLIETCQMLRRMLSAVSVRDTVLVQMQIVGDFSYGWLLVDNFTHLMQTGIKTDPTLVHKLRAVFLKLSSAMETSLLRINQAGCDGDLSSVSRYYSNQLVNYVKGLLQVIPETVFMLMAKIAHIQTHSIPELPDRLEKDKLKEFAQLENRFEVAKLTHEVSVFSAGLLSMKSTLVGIVRIDPKKLLEDGIKKELTSHISKALDAGLIFNPKTKGVDLSAKLDELGNTMDGHKRSFEYIQDYIGINGIKMWQAEMKRVINLSVEAECRRLEQRAYTGEQQQGLTFMGKLSQELVNTTDTRTSLYLESEMAWYDIKIKQKLIDTYFFKKIMKALGVPGLAGLDKILGFMIVRRLQGLINFLQREAQNNKSWLQIFGLIAKSLSPNDHTVDSPSKLYPGTVAKLQKLNTSMLDIILTVGQLQLLRKQIFYTLNHTAKCYARNYTSALSNLNEALLNEVKAYQKGLVTECPSSEDLGKVASLLDWVGIGDPYEKIYITTRSIPYMALLMFIFAASQVPRFQHDKALDCLLCKKTGEGVMPFLLGLQTVLRQFHSTVHKQFILYCCQYTKSFMLNSPMSSKQQEIPSEALSMMQFLEEYVDYSGLTRAEITKHIPALILDLFKYGIGAYIES